MTNDFYSYLEQLHSYVQMQEKRIQSLEESVNRLKEEVNVLKNRPPIKVDTIEYKFDQLKVETLDGTLNIGLNPSDLQNIEDFAVNNKGIQTPFSPQQQMKRTIEIEEEIYQYLENQLPQVITEVQEKNKLHFDESYLSFIKEDIKKQLPVRIDHHLKQFQAFSRETNESENINIKIINILTKEIRNGVETFMRNLPENIKGMKVE